ncbi:MAG: methylmalonyl-CoA mutase family protein, partial [Dehalococcoidia bacterium]
VVDPLGGSYYLEKLTDHIEEEARRYIDRIDDLGGALAAIEMGYQQKEIQESSWRVQQQVEGGRRVVVGVNRFAEDEEGPQELLRVDPEVVRRQVERLQRVRAERDNAQVERLLQRLEEAAGSDANLMPVLIECVEGYVTIGEICRVLRKVFGEQREFAGF